MCLNLLKYHKKFTRTQQVSLHRREEETKKDVRVFVLVSNSKYFLNICHMLTEDQRNRKHTAYRVLVVVMDRRFGSEHLAFGRMLGVN